MSLYMICIVSVFHQAGLSLKTDDCKSAYHMPLTTNKQINAGISYTLSKSGRPAIFARDPDGNALEFTQV